MKVKLQVIIIISILFLCSPSFGEESGTLNLNSSKEYVKINNPFSVKINIDNIQDVYALHIKLKFDPNYIKAKEDTIDLCDDIINKKHFIAINKIDNTTGKIELLITLLGNEASFNNSINIGIINFNTVKHGTTPINIQESNLLEKDGSYIYHNINNINMQIHERKKTSSTSSNTKLISNIIKEKENRITFEGLSLTIPKNTFLSDSTIHIKKISSDSSLSNIYDITCKNKFNKIKLSIKLKDNENIRYPCIYYYNEERKKWVYVGGKIENGYITTWVSHFTKFCVFENKYYKEYNDIANCWGKEYIQGLTMMGIINGTNQNTFKPNRYITRAEIAKIISLSLDLKEYSSNHDEFKDSKSIPSWATKYITSVVNQKLMIGYDDNTFKPNSNISRTEIAVIIDRILKNYQADNKEFLYTDDKEIPNWAKKSVYKMYDLGIFTGYDNGAFNPLAPITRVEACKVIVKLLEILKVI
ncbi:S-layer homology domain-containing protein [Caldisalinibacter kiritimatiensis]|uniref:S-layer-like domain containing protein n=1 Tax=Caldisalinibacter kiritimatiensis TaxID=1304284 RepID=R1AXC5_9FIRM|nr:S-layer homology domain-containing protein [Caldisalinibacter kiritimatiensis]EOD01853.1 S-layer-like domain containing protein [Caldisalinibacter kiritimatiensis]